MRRANTFFWTGLAAVAVTVGMTVAMRASATGRTPEFADTLEPKIEALLADTLVPGAAVLVQSPEFGTWEVAFGSRDREGDEPVSMNDHVRIGSNTKTMTGTLILQLVEDGRLTLDDPVAKFYPHVPNGDKVTVAHLLTMRSGLPNYSETLAFNEALDRHPAKVWKPEELLDLAFAEPILFEPGAKFHYSNTNTILLGLIAEQLTKLPIEDLMRQRIFEPLGLSQTVFPSLASQTIPAPHPRGYQYGTNVETIKTQVLSPDLQAAARAGTYKPIDMTDVNPSWAWTAGAGIATARDLAVYVKALVDGGLLTTDLQKQRLASILPTDPNNPSAAGYGYALAKMGPMYGHTGELPGFNTFMGYDPVRKVTIVTWTSLSAAPDGRAPAVEVAKLIIANLYGGEDGVKPPSASGEDHP